MQATILCYHKVGSVESEGRRLNIEPERLRSHVRFFSRKKRPFVRARDLAGSWPSGAVCFTFDDAYDSTMAHAPSIFEQFGVRASFYAVAGLVGSASSWDGELARPLADWETLRTAQAAGHEIGNHSLTHPRLAELSVEEQTREILAARDQLRSQQIDAGSFCFPYGIFSAATLDQIKAAGYKVGLALGKRNATGSDDKLSLPRIVVAYSDALPMLLYKIVLKPRLR